VVVRGAGTGDGGTGAVDDDDFDDSAAAGDASIRSSGLAQEAITTASEATHATRVVRARISISTPFERGTRGAEAAGPSMDTRVPGRSSKAASIRPSRSSEPPYDPLPRGTR
jgi:hypothetical protein